MATDAAFLAEISVFLTTNELQAVGPRPETNRLCNAGQDAFSQEVGTGSTSSPGSPMSDCIDVDSEAPALTSVRTRSRGNETKATKRKIRQQKEALRKQRYQRRLKHERETLRRMEIELSRHLKKLQQEVEKKQPGSVEKLALAQTVWKDLAVQQRELRNRAEKEQKKLVNAVSIQASYLAILRGLLPKDQYDVDAIQQETCVAIASSLHMNTFANCALYEEHFRRVVEDYGNVDEVFREFNLDVMADGITKFLCRDETSNDVKYFQHFNKFTEPFSFKKTHETMWTLAKLHHRQQDRDDYDGIGDPNDTVIIRFRLRRALVTGAGVSVMQRYVFRRFVGETRTVFTWKTYSEGEDIFAGMQLEETGWACLQPSIQGDSTVIGVCVRQSPMQFGSSSSSRAASQGFYSVMQSSVTEDARAITSTLSRLLLEETLEGINVYALGEQS